MGHWFKVQVRVKLSHSALESVCVRVITESLSCRMYVDSRGQCGLHQASRVSAEYSLAKSQVSNSNYFICALINCLLMKSS